jgi:hypothetical protein
MQPKDPALRKRTQIAKANRMMFVWVAAVSVVLGFALVGSIFLAQKLFFNEKVLMEKEKTVATLKSNNAVIPDLEAQVRVLNTNQALIDAKANPGDQAVQVILDALPSDANSLALGASLQSRLLAGIPNLTINSIRPDPVLGVESLSSDTTVDPSLAGSSSDNQITFQFSVSGDQTALKQVLTNLERSIRTIDIISLKIESQNSVNVLTVQGRAFYEPTRVVQLKDKVVR